MGGGRYSLVINKLNPIKAHFPSARQPFHSCVMEDLGRERVFLLHTGCLCSQVADVSSDCVSGAALLSGAV